MIERVLWKWILREGVLNLFGFGRFWLVVFETAEFLDLFDLVYYLVLYVALLVSEGVS